MSLPAQQRQATVNPPDPLDDRVLKPRRTPTPAAGLRGNSMGEGAGSR
jgi:hypothetical protein